MIRYAKQQDELSLRSLWETCFQGEPEFTELFFKSMYQPEFCRVIDINGIPAAMLHAFPYSLSASDYLLNSYYIYGVGCAPEYRGRGYAGQLIEDALLRARSGGLDLCMLIPQDDGLFGYYERFGFYPRFFKNTVSIEKMPAEELDCSPATPRDLAQINDIYEKSLKSFIFAKRNKRHWEMLLDEARLSKGDIFIAKESRDICAYAVFYVKDKTLVINEMFSLSEYIYKQIPSFLAARNGCSDIELTRPGNEDKIGAAHIITDSAGEAFNKQRGYLNLMHN